MSTEMTAGRVVAAVHDTLAAASGQGSATSALSVIVSWLVPAAIAAVVSWLICWRTLRSGTRDRLNSQIDRLVELGVEYPLMEDDPWCDSWSRENRTEDGMRYDNYCCFVFNVLEGLWRFNHGNVKPIQDMFDADEMMWRHRRWWEYPDNQGSYPRKFREYVKKELAKRGKSNG